MLPQLSERSASELTRYLDEFCHVSVIKLGFEICADVRIGESPVNRMAVDNAGRERRKMKFRRGDLIGLVGEPQSGSDFYSRFVPEGCLHE